MTLAGSTVLAKRAALFALLVIVAAGTAFGQAYDFGPARQSIETLVQLRDQIRSWANVISAPPPQTASAQRILLQFPRPRSGFTFSCGIPAQQRYSLVLDLGSAPTDGIRYS